MALCITFPNRALQRADMNGATAVQHRLANDSRVGGVGSESEDLTILFSGTLTSVPAPHRPCMGAAAASVLAGLYRRHGTTAFAQVDGAFCAAIVDRERDAIVLARDKLGIARAYLSRQGGSVTFSDSLSDLMVARGERHEVDVDSLYAFLMIGWIPTPHSMFRDIEKVPAGTILEFRRGVFETTTYYDVPHRAGDVVSRSPAQLSREVTEHLDRSVGRGLALGGRWGSFLSGGVDSSSVVASIGHQTESAFPTYFGGFAPQLNQYLPNPEEPEMSRLVSETCGSEHHMLWLGPEAVDRTSEVVGALEEPVCDGGCIVLAAVMEEAQGVADGLMTGIGGDFLFTGERRHKVLGLLRYMRPVPTPIWRLATASLGMPFVAKNARASQAHFDLTRLVGLQGMPLPEMYAGFFLQAEPSELEELFESSAYSALARDPLAEMKRLFAEAAEIDPIAQFLYLDLKTQSTEHCLREAETLGRHFGLLVHNPLVDADFVDFAMTVPSSAKVARLQLKLPLRDAMRSRLPDRVLDRKKGGLGSPIRWWVTQPTGAVADRLSESHLGGRGIVRPEVIERFRALTASGAKDYSKLLWSLFTLELWFERFVDSAPATESVRP